LNLCFNFSSKEFKINPTSFVNFPCGFLSLFYLFHVFCTLC
jgi:hypothetical protein